MNVKKKSKAGTYLSIGTSLFGVVGVVRQLRTARRDHDTLELVDGIISAAALISGVALLARELRRMNNESTDLFDS
ncbi:hypothetical protein [Streptomyces alkaliphilus]|uniref:Uncharacterized protein n=1 Tax=Streptomyces alkaliphilus TaxID=1472722 RepID=A0A7W3Y287_9ACTN|nr:hypothetical protein [Streptomyces alkaliphilus]MBB0245080.1 hypothetical protein [Streptomyces alkaliphilus]MQS08703.1 hypothetical protein [Streptomyces alkaliphilus]